LFANLDVRGNIEYGMRRRQHNGVPDIDHIVGLLGLEQLLGRRSDELSGGEAQRVAIARALLCAPRFVLMDEPLASLDQARKEEILPFLDRLHAEAEVPIIYVSHNLDEVCRLCDHLVVIDNGHVVADGELQTVLVDLDVPVLRGQQAGSVIQGSAEDYDENDDLTHLRFSGGDLWVPGRAGPQGSALRLRIHANDVSLCRTRPEQSTILNILPAVVETIQSADGPSVLVRLALGTDRIVARVTRRSLRMLALKEGDEVFAQIKSVAVRPTV
jgi:molybdate transport system ATP-binding protein